jgi:hypothetical protein
LKIIDNYSCEAIGNIYIEIKHNQIRKKPSVTLMQVSSRGLTKRMLLM